MHPALELSQLVLQQGGHPTPEDGLCVMEAVSYFAGLQHSAAPVDTDPVLTVACLLLNDRWDRASRQKLRCLVPYVNSTRGTASLSRRRAFFIVDRVIRFLFVEWLCEQPKPRIDLADRFVALQPINDWKSAAKAHDLARWCQHEAQRFPLRHVVTAVATSADAARDAISDLGVREAVILAECAAAVEAAVEVAAAVLDVVAVADDNVAQWRALGDRTQDRMIVILSDAIAIGETP